MPTSLSPGWSEHVTLTPAAIVLNEPLVDEPVPAPSPVVATVSRRRLRWPLLAAAGTVAVASVAVVLATRGGEQVAETPDAIARADLQHAVTVVERCYRQNANAYPVSATGDAPDGFTLACGGGTEHVDLHGADHAVYVAYNGSFALRVWSPKSDVQAYDSVLDDPTHVPPAP